MGRALNTFLVHDHHDMLLLRALYKQAGFYGSVVITSFDTPLHNIPASRRLSQHGAQSLMDVIKCTSQHASNAVLNYLIDNSHIEAVALCSTGWSDCEADRCRLTCKMAASSERKGKQR
jgi:hypothetical protein